MIRENLFYRILSAIHIVFFSSILCFGTIYLTGTLLMIPALAASLMICKDYLYKKLDINNSIVMTYLRYIKGSLKLMKFLPINFIMILNIFAMLYSIKSNYFVYSIVCLTITVLLLLLMLYIAGFYAFVNEKVDIIEVVISIIIKPQFALPVFAALVIGVSFFSITLMFLLLLTGAFFLFALSILILLNMLHYKKVIGTLSEEDEYYHLIGNTKKRR